MNKELETLIEKLEAAIAVNNEMLTIVRGLLAEHASVASKPTNDGWIKWNGGENPVPGKIVEVKLRGGHQSTCHKSEDETWYVVGDNYDIIAYRVVD